MSANSSTPSPTSGSRLHEEEDSNDLTADLDLGFDGAEDLLRVWRQGMRPDPNLTVVDFHPELSRHFHREVSHL